MWRIVENPLTHHVHSSNDSCDAVDNACGQMCSIFSSALTDTSFHVLEISREFVPIFPAILAHDRRKIDRDS
jgi:hypothetical protein